jgi:serine/threonine protein kinase
MEFNSKQSSDHLLQKIYFNKFKLIRKIGEGSFGLIYMAQNIISNEFYALKFEDKNTGQNLLESEAYVMGYLKGGIYNLIY